MKKFASTMTLTIVMSLTLMGCESTYYSAMEQVGYHKRDIMVDRVVDAKESQQDAQQQFTSALEEMQALVNHDGGDLEDAYNAAKDEYESAQSAADDVGEKIDKVESVANALFDEWQQEIGEISKASLRNKSEAKLKETQRSYNSLITSMRSAQAKMPPVLTTMKDNMLYLKHNLNAQTIGSIKGEFDSLKTDISSLIDEMNNSINESNKFIASMEGNG